MIKMRHYVLMAAVLLISKNTLSQAKAVIQFNSYNAVGIVAGNAPIGYTFQTVNGVKFKNWFAGAGFGTDNYFMATLPLFADIKREFKLHKSLFFLYADIGGHFIANDKKVAANFTTSTKGNLYFDAGLGIKMQTTRKGHLFFSAGNALKNITQTMASTDSGFPYKNEFVYKLSRISIRAGYQF